MDRNPGVLGWSPVGLKSLSARRAWIEIAILGTGFLLALVALRKESVDRNIMYLLTASGFFIVALRKESVDRNSANPLPITSPTTVALRKESVDRNNVVVHSAHPHKVALRKESVDRNIVLQKNKHCQQVALRKESVDRNPYLTNYHFSGVSRSPQGERG